MGLSVISLYTELIMFAHASLYGAVMGYSFITYGDSLSQAIQSLGLIILVAVGTASLSSALPKVIVVLAYFACIFSFLPKELAPWLIRGNIVFVTIARGSQILKNFSGEKGAQSCWTTFFQAAGTGAKLWTTTQEIGFDLNLIR